MTQPKSSRINTLLEIVTFNNQTKLGFLLTSALVLTGIIVALGGAKVLPYDPIQQNVGSALDPPSPEHLFGTDLLGRDVFSRIAYATPNDLFVAFFVTGFCLVVGLLLGAIAGYKGGWLDETLMRCTDVFFAIPSLILAMSIAVILGAGIINMMYALCMIWWPPYARLARGETLRVVNYNFVEAAKASGLGTPRILLKHIFPNILTSIVAYATVDIGSVVIIYAGLSYLGLSVRPPVPEWGAMVGAYQDYLISAPWLPLFPALFIGLVVVAFSLVGDGLRDAVESARIR